VSHRRLPPSPKSDFIWRWTKKIAARAGFKRNVYPYLIKPSAITDGFNQKVNPKVLQKQARHRKIETTLHYANTAAENMIRGILQSGAEMSKHRCSGLQRKVRVWLDKLLAGETDTKTFKNGIDILLQNSTKKGDGVAYL